MGSLKDFLSKLFKKQTSQYQAPFLHETYKFDTSSEQYVLWIGDESHSALSQIIRNTIAETQEEREKSSMVDFFENEKMAGVSLPCRLLPFDKKDYLNLMGITIERLKQQGYVLSLSEIKSREKANNIEQSIKAYLKPSRKLVRDRKAEQLFGNVNLELLTINEQLSRLNLSCSYYQDQNFHDPIKFSQFIHQNFKNERQ